MSHIIWIISKVLLDNLDQNDHYFNARLKKLWLRLFGQNLILTIMIFHQDSSGNQLLLMILRKLNVRRTFWRILSRDQFIKLTYYWMRFSKNLSFVGRCVVRQSSSVSESLKNCHQHHQNHDFANLALKYGLKLIKADDYYISKAWNLW